MRAQVRGRAVTVEPPAEVGGKPFLVVQLLIECDICGEHDYVIAGHHLRPIVSLLQEFIQTEPELTAEGEVEAVGMTMKRMRFDPDSN